MNEENGKKISVLFAAFEADPFVKTGGLGDVAGSLPGAISNDDYDVRVILPKLSVIAKKYCDQMEFITSFEVELGWRHQYCGLFELRHEGVRFYFLDNEYYFKRSKVYGEYDDGERIAFFSKAVLESLSHIPDFFPSILHCNDWHTALVPVYLHEHYWNRPGYNGIRTVFTVHNLKFQGVFPSSILDDVLGLADTPAAGQLIRGDTVNYMQGALRYSDRITTVSPTYAQEICTPEYGEGMEWLFSQRRDVLYGILNGIDNDQYDPERYEPPFSMDNLTQKRVNKEELQRDLGLSVDGNIPMFSIVSRLTEQKGLDLVTYNLPEIISRPMQLVVLGVGEYGFEEAFQWYSGAFPTKVYSKIAFDSTLSRRLYACSDVLLMPSRFEPCGLAQMMAMRYGTLPLVRETGGLKDSVRPYNRFTGEGTGFSFANYNAHELIACIDYALDVWNNSPERWESMMNQAMRADFSWSASAEKYRILYRGLIE